LNAWNNGGRDEMVCQHEETVYQEKEFDLVLSLKQTQFNNSGRISMAQQFW
jgi:hypothetical protein